MFISSINKDIRAIINEISGQWGDLPVYIGGSGNFSVERILFQKGIKKIYSNDVLIQSCALGNYLSGKPMNVSVFNPKYAWLEEYFKSPEDTVAALLVCSEYFRYVENDYPYFVRMSQAYKEQFKRLHSDTLEMIQRVFDGVLLKDFVAQDVIDFIDSIPQESVAMSLFRNYGRGFDMASENFDLILNWDKPDYCEVDKERFQAMIKSLQRKKYWVLITQDEIEELQTFMAGYVQKIALCKPYYLYTNTEMINKRLVKPKQYLEDTGFKRLKNELKGDLKIVNLTRGQFNLIRSEYLKIGLMPATADVAFGILVGDELIGAAGFKDTRSRTFCDTYLVSDFSIKPTIYKRLSKLVLVAVLSEEMQGLLEQTFNAEIRHIGTTAFTEKSVSMKYRGLFNLYSRGAERLNYFAPAGRWSLKEGYALWKNNYSQTISIK